MASERETMDWVIDFVLHETDATHTEAVEFYVWYTDRPDVPIGKALKEWLEQKTTG